MRIVNFAHGALIMLAMYLTFFIHDGLGWDPFFAVLVVGPVGFVAGMFLYNLVLSPVLAKGAFVQLFTTLGLALVIENAVLYWLSATYRTVTTSYTSSTIPFLGALVSIPRLVAFGVAVIAGGGLFAYLQFSDSGRAIRATAQDPAAASALGIDTNRVFRLTFALSTGLAAVAGALLAPILPIFPRVGETLILVGFAVVVLGGLGSFVGALAGGLVIGLVEVFSGFLVGEAFKQGFYFAVLMLVLMIRPTGFFGQRGAEEFKIS
jgi:branched-chain amino acid transport system permease protein